MDPERCQPAGAVKVHTGILCRADTSACRDVLQVGTAICWWLLSLVLPRQVYFRLGSTAGTPGSDRLARDLPFAVAGQLTVAYTRTRPSTVVGERRLQSTSLDDREGKNAPQVQLFDPRPSAIAKLGDLPRPAPGSYRFW